MKTNFGIDDEIRDVIAMIIPAIVDQRADRVAKMTSRRSGDEYFDEITINTNKSRFLETSLNELTAF